VTRQRSVLVVAAAVLAALCLPLTAGGASAVDGAGTVATWGDNTYGELGDGTKIAHRTPVEIPSFADIADVEGGREHALALTSGGAVYAWGWNRHGQVGNGSTAYTVLAPVQVLTGAIDIGAGHYSSYAVKSDGTVWGWGQNTTGQIGPGTTETAVRTPTLIDGLDGIPIVDVAGGRNHALALTSGETVYAWGANQYGQLGIGTLTASSTPAQVSSLSGVVSIFAGRDHSLAVKADGTVWAWGYNANGELGDGTTTKRTVPVQVRRANGDPLTNVVQVSAGADHSLALRSNGTIWTWGLNTDGQLGDGTFSSRRRAVKVGLAGVQQIAAGRQGSIAVTVSGDVYAWGDNVYGQLGDGTQSSTGRNTPGKVPSLANVSVVGMGRDFGMAIVVPSG
jgi:alpha-tubulin suppressor-like RCC1 family protein